MASGRRQCVSLRQSTINQAVSIATSLLALRISLMFYSLSSTVPPMIWVPNQLIGASVGEEVTLECATEAFPLSLNYWTKDDTFMIVNSDKYKMSNSENTYKVHMKLTILKVTAEDYGKLLPSDCVPCHLTTSQLSAFLHPLCKGTYKCHAKNSLSSTQASIRIYGKSVGTYMSRLDSAGFNCRRERINWALQVD